ncbi:MAG TPA: T9SS type A sorting domain-containing protein [Bacteroidia bacterium]|jgi:uncharacterized repeat protein (TIGR01451 family)|nr:T9SS type A sorting domain-containing protein [Bacteroidia bacterium]
MRNLYAKNLITLLMILLGVMLVTKASAGVSVSIVSHSNVYCHGAANGSATASISGGTGPFAYSWTPSGGNTLTASGLSGGNYTCTVTDSSTMSTASAVVYISEPAQIIMTPIVTPAACQNSCNGSVQANFTGGTPPFSYSWSGMGNGFSVTNLCSGTSYTVVVTDAYGCTGIGTGVMYSTDSLSLTTSATNSGCSGNSGSVTANAVKGSVPYTYSWNTGSTTSSLNNLGSGIYTVTVQDHSGCSVTANATVSSSSGLAVTVSQYNVSCFGMNTGSASMFPSGGQTPYTYSWNPSGVTAASATGLAAGIYTAYCIDANGCSYQNIVTISEPPQLIVNMTTNPSTCGACDGNASVNVSGGTGPYIYTWQPSYSGSSYASNLCAGTYTCMVTDAQNCTFYSSGVVTNSGSITASITNTASGCTTCSGTATVTPSGGHLPYTYSWSNAQTTQSVTNLCPVSYSVTVTDSNGCSFLAQTTISNNSGLTAAPTSTNTTCWNTSNGTATANASGAVPPYTYSWSPGGMTTASISNLSPGHYTVFVSDQTGCTVSSSTTLGNAPYIYMSISTTPDNCNTQTGSATVNAFGGTPPYLYSWSSGASGSTISGLGTGNYSVVCTDLSGCTSSEGINVGTTCYDIIRGTVWDDPNLNCVYDNGDHHAYGRFVYTVPGYYYAYTDTAGRYTIWVPVTGNYTVYALGNSNYTYHCPSPPSNAVNFTVIPDTSSNNNFAGHYISPVPNAYQDIAVYLSSGIARPGFPLSYSIYYVNSGTVSVNASLTFTHDAQLTGFTSSLPPSSYAAPTATWNLGILNPGQSGTISVTLQVPTLSSTACMGCSLTSSAVINPITGDAYPSDNTATDITVIQGSFDPNFKECQTPGEDYSNGNITLQDTLLTYTIHFQNTGTDTAFTVVVKDSLSPYLDPATIKPAMASNPFSFAAHNGEMIFTFNHIMLPDSNHSEPLSQGFIQYQVKTKPGLAMGTRILNKARIYFDFNPPVNTNTTSNTIQAPASVPVHSGTPVNLYPNPFDETTLLVISGPVLEREFILYDITGREMRRFRSSENSVTINRDNLAKGLYLLKVFAGNESEGEQKLIIR